MVNEISLFPVCVGRQHEQQWVARLTAALLHVTAAIVQIPDSLMCLTFILLPTDSFLFACLFPFDCILFRAVSLQRIAPRCGALHAASLHNAAFHCTS